MNALYFHLLTSRRLLFLVLLPIVWRGQTIVWWGANYCLVGANHCLVGANHSESELKGLQMNISNRLMTLC